MDVENALAEINEILGIDAVTTIKGDEIKFWAYDHEDACRVKAYMNRAAMDRLIKSLEIVRDSLG